MTNRGNPDYIRGFITAGQVGAALELEDRSDSISPLRCHIFLHGVLALARELLLVQLAARVAERRRRSNLRTNHRISIL